MKEESKAVDADNAFDVSMSKSVGMNDCHLQLSYVETGACTSTLTDLLLGMIKPAVEPPRNELTILVW